ncbi:MAG TPA: DNA ligase [Thermomonas sp.]|nr:DNA ligase [Thermomonas sp.]
MDLRPALLAVLLLAAQQPAHAATPLHAAPAPMLASRVAGDIDVASYLVSEKLDGVRARWDGRALWTRSGSRIDVPASFTRGWPAQPMDGELWLGRGRFQEISDLVRALRCHDRAWRPVRFMAFDLPGDNDHFARRTLRLQALVDAAGSAQLEHIPQRHLASRARLEAHLQAVMAGGGEGLMLHHALAPYRAGRSDALLKFKLGQDAEARVVGYRPGKGKYTGMVGALLVEDALGRRFALGSGLRDADRAAPPAIGTTVTFRYDGLTATGTPRFARYLRVRRD